ncbi:HAD family hydrolase [Sorangium sp. So ce381]|uniref:HAD family hydrolase n=1 Tax=Sorangium sp. So ce381 TaxID=3133307 RepID=UPI003F5C6C70
MEALRLVALDLDGTLLRTDGSISARTRSALAMAEAAGLTLMSVTARPPRRVRQVAAQTGLRGTAICSNGGLVYDVTNDAVLRQNLLPAAAASVLIESLRAAVPGVAFAVEAGIQYGCERGYVIPGEHPNDRDDPRMRRDDAVALCREGVTKLIVQHAGWTLEELLEVTRAHAGALASVTHSGSNFVEVAAAGVTKALALEAYCAEHGIAAAQVIAFGDMPNDLPMLGWAGRGVAVANAHPHVLAAADEVTSANDHDGVALVLERLAHLGFVPSWC